MLDVQWYCRVQSVPQKLSIVERVPLDRESVKGGSTVLSMDIMKALCASCTGVYIIHDLQMLFLLMGYKGYITTDIVLYYLCYYSRQLLSIPITNGGLYNDYEKCSVSDL